MKTQLNWKERVLELGKFYQHDLPSAENLDMELLAWKVEWDSHTTELPAEPQQTLRLTDYNYFLNVQTLLKSICTIPVTSCACEQSISTLRRVKTYIRSTMGNERLKGLLLMNIYYGINVNLEKVDTFARKHSRRMKLTNILSNDEEL